MESQVNIRLYKKYILYREVNTGDGMKQLPVVVMVTVESAGQTYI